MPEHTGAERPGGRTAATRRAVHDAVRWLQTQPDPTISVPAVATRSGISASTIYRRWHTIESLVLDVAVDDLNTRLPVPCSGDLEVDLRAYVPRLLAHVHEEGHFRFFALMVSAQRSTEGAIAVELVRPRLEQFQAMLDAAGVTRLDAIRLVELIMAPAYFWAQLGVPLDPARDAERLIEAALLHAGR